MKMEKTPKKQCECNKNCVYESNCICAKFEYEKTGIKSNVFKFDKK